MSMIRILLYLSVLHRVGKRVSIVTMTIILFSFRYASESNVIILLHNSKVLLQSVNTQF